MVQVALTHRLLAYCPKTGFHDRMFPYVASIAEKSWKAGPYPGVELLVLHVNDVTGGITALRKFHAGVTIPAHTHPLANESVYVLSGEWEESGALYAAGAFFFAPRGQRHGPHTARTEVISLTIFDGPLTVVEAGDSPSSDAGDRTPSLPNNHP